MTAPFDKRILVLGVGNPLMGDEGVGPRVVEHLLSGRRFPDNVEVVDAGTMGFAILNLLQQADVVIVVDAVRGTGHEPGTVVRLDPESMAPNQIMHSLHDARLPDVLDAAKLMGLDLEVVCIGVEIAEIVHWKVELSPVVEAAIVYAAGAVEDVLTEFGATATNVAGSGDAGDRDADGEKTAHVIKAMRTRDDVAAVDRTPDDAGT